MPFSHFPVPSIDPSSGSLFAVFEPAIVKRRERALKDIDHRPINLGILNRARPETEVILVVLFVDGDMDDLLSVRDHCQIRVVRDNDDLTALFGVLEKLNENLVDTFVIQVILRLINHERYVATVEHQIENQEETSTFTRGQLLQIFSIDFEVILCFQIIEAEEVVIEINGLLLQSHLLKNVTFGVFALSCALVGVQVLIDSFQHGENCSLVLPVSDGTNEVFQDGLAVI